MGSKQAGFSVADCPMEAILMSALPIDRGEMQICQKTGWLGWKLPITACFNAFTR